MRKRKTWIMWGILFLAAALLLFVYSYGSQASVEKKERVKYSVILYQYTDNEWQLLSEGIRQAERDFGVDVNLVTMAKEDGAEEQKNLIEREIQNGAQGIMAAAVDSEKVKEKLLEIEKDIPVITIETGVGEEITHIGTDDYEMGYDLGVKILEDYQGIGPCYVTIIKEYMERISVQERFRGLMDALEITGRDVRIKTCARGEGDYNLALFLRKEMSEWYQDAVVALDKNTLEQSIEARQYWEAEKSERKPAFHLPGLYGIGNTEKTVNGLDSASVKALAYQNEFNMGYQGLEILINKKKNMFQDEVPVIKNQIVEKDTLYETENQRLLFPFS